MLIEWETWNADAFARAARERKPVLLSITAAWCQACHEMDRTTYADASVAQAIRMQFVPIRVDTDQRPDINERYNLGGWPTTAFLTPSGDVLAGGTFVPLERMRGVLQRVAAECAARTELFAGDQEIRGTSEVRSDLPISCDLPPIESIVESIFSTYDDEYGGFGIEPKFPHTAPLHLAIELWRESPSPRWQSIVEHTLDAIATGGLHDSSQGGYFRYATTRAWQLPHREKLLETNAAILRACAEASLAFGRSVDRERCAALVAFLRGTLAVEGGGYYGSDADRILYLDANASVTRALLSASVALEDQPLGRDALASFERVLLACYKPGHGVAHYFDGRARVRSLLGDHVAAMHALVDAHDLGAGEPYRMLAEELALYMCSRMEDAAAGGFFDRANEDDDLGLLRQRRKPFVGNAEAAAALARVARTGGAPELIDRARGAMRSAAAQLDGQGVQAAHYVLALRMVDSSHHLDIDA